jgi:hypothetical protein
VATKAYFKVPSHAPTAAESKAASASSSSSSLPSSSLPHSPPVCFSPTQRYAYAHPEGTGKPTSPFASIWFMQFLNEHENDSNINNKNNNNNDDNDDGHTSSRAKAMSLRLRGRMFSSVGGATALLTIIFVLFNVAP